MWMRLLRRLQPVFLLLALLFVGLLLRSQWAELRAYSWQLDWRWLTMSALFLLASWLLEIAIWRNLLQLVGGVLTYGAAVRIWFLSAVMRYIPGNVWQPLTMTVLSRRHGARPEATVTSVVLFQAVILLAVAPMAALYMLLAGNLGRFSDLLQGATWWLLALAMLPVIAFVLRPQLLIQLVNWGLAKLGRAILPVRLTTLHLLLLLLAAAVNWVLWGASFAALTFGLGSYSPGEIAQLTPYLVLSFPIAFAIGFLALVTPSGFGVREGAFVLLLAPVLDAGVVTVVALAMRLWSTVGELLMAGVSVVWGRMIQAPEVQTSPFAASPDESSAGAPDAVADPAYEG